jgi:hypothetical protein
MINSPRERFRTPTKTQNRDNGAHSAPVNEGGGVPPGGADWQDMIN